MIAGTADAIVDYEVNALPVPERAPGSILVTIDGATHAGFANVTAGMPYACSAIPDALGCSALWRSEDAPKRRACSWACSAREDEGFIVPERYPPACARGSSARSCLQVVSR